LILNSVGFDVGYIDGEHAERFAGTSAYDLRKLVSFAIDSIASQSNRPLHLSINLGFILSAGSLAAAMWLVIRFLIYGVAVAGWTSVMVSMFFLSGLLFANIGVLGIYLGKVFNESKNRPLYIIKEIVGPSMRDERSSARRGLPTAHVPATDSGQGQAEPLAENSPSYTS
jgi:dolichol-phosphate mannosyltransferase